VEGFNINHEHKTWTPEDRLRYEKEMVFFRLKIAGVIFVVAMALLFTFGRLLVGG